MEVEQINLVGWADRRSVQSSLERGIQLVASRGVIDSAKLGITGMSDGSTSVEYALSNSTAFSAAAISNCCMSPGTLIALAGPQNGRRLSRIGYPGPSIGTDAEAFWGPFSMVANPDRVVTPLLMQLADQEYLRSLEVFTALREQGKAVEMYVFPDEYHVKFQPAHRLAIYQRNIEWFDFWLNGSEDSNPIDPDQYSRWNAMKAEMAKK
jgi:hypothetical protein